ncbi:MAG: endonuclease/exonuclease/phosphatase family protein [Roseburia sp.]|nr:endonuclease/exonuclease/phosphatase family protein [Roseburia sp.]
MIINLMTWNTGLYIFGNKMKDKSLKPIEDKANKIADEIFGMVKNFLEKEKAIAILQEVPYVSNLNWKKHPWFEKFVNVFPEEKYCSIYNKTSSKQALKMTVVLAKKDLIYPMDIERKNNLYVSFQILPNTPNQFTALAVHAHDAEECLDYLRRNCNTNYSLILGDFNAGNYIKEKNDRKIAKNRESYLKLINGYIDICQGEYTTKYKYPTYVDHVLLRSKYSFLQTHKVNNLEVNRRVSHSDHYPITFELELL